MRATRIDRPVRAGYVGKMEAIGDYYATLRVEPDADDAALRLAYRTLMRRHHPDVSVEGDAENQCQAINEAYACLRDPSKRAAYDARQRAQRSSRQPATPMSPRAYHSTWGAQYADRSARESARQSKGWKATAIGIAIALTIATFAATSAVDSPGKGEGDPVVVTLKPSPEQLRAQAK